MSRQVIRGTARAIRRQRLPSRVRLVSGRSELATTADDVILVCLVRDGEAHIRSFLQHHFDLGVRHAVLVDNDSIDRTVELAREFDRVTVLHTSLPFRRYNNLIRSYVAERFGRHNWCLDCDIDERFVHPMSDRVSLAEFVRYLNRQEYTAVVAQMLDLFAGGAVDTWPGTGDSLVNDCRWYDTSAIRTTGFDRHYRNRISSDAIRCHYGGIRGSVFGLNDLVLTKHPLLSSASGARRVTSHDCSKAYVADVSCVLFHYPFDRGFRKKCALAIERGNYWRSSLEYKAYLKGLDADSQLTLKRTNARRLDHLSQLLDENFIVVSEQYRLAFA